MSNLLWACLHRGTMPQLRKVKPAVGGNTLIAEEMLEGRMEYPTHAPKPAPKVALPPPPKPSGVPGVTWSKDKQRWIARIFRNNKHYSAGTHETPLRGHSLPATRNWPNLPTGSAVCRLHTSKTRRILLFPPHRNHQCTASSEAARQGITTFTVTANTTWSSPPRKPLPQRSAASSVWVLPMTRPSTQNSKTPGRRVSSAGQFRRS